MASSVSGAGVPPPSSAGGIQKRSRSGTPGSSHTPSRAGVGDSSHVAERSSGAGPSGAASGHRRADPVTAGYKHDGAAEAASGGLREDPYTRPPASELRNTAFLSRGTAEAHVSWSEHRARHVGSPALHSSSQQRPGVTAGASPLGTGGFSFSRALQAWPFRVAKRDQPEASGARRLRRQTEPTPASADRPASFILHPLLVIPLAVALGAAIINMAPASLSSAVLSSVGLGGTKAVTPSQLHGLVEELQRKHMNLATKLQVQVDVLAKKVDQSDEKREELRRQVERQQGEMKEQLQELSNRVVGMDQSLQELVASGSPRLREHVLQLVEEVIKGRATSDSPITLDDVRKAARAVVEMELQTHSADGIGREDFALASMGARVVRHSNALAHPGLFNPLIPIARQALRLADLHAEAQQLLHPRFGTPGSCLPLLGHTGFVEIALQQHVHISAVSLEHIDKAVAFDVSSAPKDFRVFGASSPLLRSSWLSGGFPSPGQLDRLHWHQLGKGVYSTGGPPVQTFPVSSPPTLDPLSPSDQISPAAVASASAFNFVRFAFLSNHGHPSYTCLYRVRVHGTSAGTFWAPGEQ